MMNIHNQQQLVEAAVNAALSKSQQQKNHQQLYTVEQFSKVQPAFSQAALRNYIFKADSRQSSKGKIDGNGLIECGALIRIGRKVLIDGDKFLNWVHQQNWGGL